MKSRVLFLLAIMVGSTNMSAQNLVPNGSFEEGIECPSFIANLDAQCSNWFGSVIDDLNFTPTPDWFHECSEFESLTPPNVAFGYQEPLDGSGYAGITIFDSNDDNYREIIGVELTQALIPNQNYELSFFVSRLEADGAQLAANNMGFALTTYPNYSTASFPTNEAFFKIDSILTDTASWTQISVDIIADSAYTYLHIGNFYDDESTDTLKLHLNAVVSYYIIDQISMYSTLNIRGNNVQECFRSYPNPVTDLLQIDQSCSAEITGLSIIDLTGKVLFNLPHNSSEHIQIDISSLGLAKGIYILHITTKNSYYNEKFFKL